MLVRVIININILHAQHNVSTLKHLIDSQMFIDFVI